MTKTSTTLNGVVHKTGRRELEDEANAKRYVLGNFELLEKLGEGAYATAYKARQLGMDRDAVVKIARDHLLSGQHADLIRSRFEIEVRASSRCAHPNVVTIYTSGHVDGAPALAMEYVEGDTLDDVLRAHAPLDEARFVSMFSKLAGALAALHEVGIVHRDVSSKNIMVSRTPDKHLEPKLLDFGISQLDGSGLQTAGPIGTPQFMAPELLRGETTSAVDIFSLGLLMWWAGSGELFMPLEANQFEIFKFLSSMSGPPQLTSSLNHLSPGVRDIIQRALDPDPDHRPTAADLCSSFKRETQTGMGSSELLSLRPISKSTYAPPELLKMLVLEHPDHQLMELGRSLPTRGFEVTRIGIGRRKELLGTLERFDVILSPLPSRSDSDMRAHLLSLILERERLNDPFVIYGYGTTRLPERMLANMGVENSWVLPTQVLDMRDTLESLARTNTSGQWTRIDSDMLMRSLEEDSVFTQDLLDEFVGEMPELLLELEECLDYEDAKGLLKISGNLSARASSIGAERMLMLARELCELARNRYATRGMEIVREIEDEYKILFVELKALRQLDDRPLSSPHQRSLK